MKATSARSKWKFSNANNFWKKIARFDHVLQIYENDGVFLDALTGFVMGVKNSDETAVVIATNTHLNALEYRLQSYGIDVEELISNNKFIPLSAEDTLAELIIDGRPDEQVIKKMASELFDGHKKIRAFGEMVAILWTQGNKEAAIELENLWNKVSRHDRLSLFCAYPKSSFKDDEINSVMTMCEAHTKIISGSEKQLTHILYKEVA
jgi:hypothetical protein